MTFGLFLCNVALAAICVWEEIVVGGPTWFLMSVINIVAALALWHWREEW